jgi:plasmid stabilization system protein ParE
LSNEASLHAAAAQDLASIAAYIRERNPPAALRVRAAILESLQSLVLFPRTPILRFIFSN